MQFCRYGPSLLWAEFVWDDFVMGRDCNGPSLLWAEMSSFRKVDQAIYAQRNIVYILKKNSSKQCFFFCCFFFATASEQTVRIRSGCI